MILSIDHVTKEYGSLKALDDISLELQPGVYALLGPNGAGKSTLMNLITDNLTCTEGTISFDGQEIHSMGRDYREKIGYMPQQQGMYDSFTAIRFLSYMASLKGMKTARAKKEIARVLELVNLSDKASQKISSFSGGMKQRLLIAQAILNDPDILILDEPTAGLDPKERIRIRNIVSEIAKDKIVLYATHVVSDVEQIASRVILISKGKILSHEKPEDLIRFMKGKVFEVQVPAEDLDPIKQQYLVCNIVTAEKGFRVRILNDGLPQLENAIEVPPSLEDVYLYAFGQPEAGEET